MINYIRLNMLENEYYTNIYRKKTCIWTDARWRDIQIKKTQRPKHVKNLYPFLIESR
jgi:hypothetical protein